MRPHFLPFAATAFYSRIIWCLFLPLCIHSKFNYFDRWHFIRVFSFDWKKSTPNHWKFSFVYNYRRFVIVCRYIHLWCIETKNFTKKWPLDLPACCAVDHRKQKARKTRNENAIFHFSVLLQYFFLRCYGLLLAVAISLFLRLSHFHQRKLKADIYIYRTIS